MGVLDGSVALVTGAGRGQGRAHAVTLAGHGADIIAVDINADIDGMPYPLATAADLAQTVKEVEQCGRRAIAVQADIRSQSQMDDAVARGLEDFGKLDIVIANAGIWDLTPVWEITEEQWDRIVGTNLGGTWRTVRACLPHFKERRTGSIVVTASVNGLEPSSQNAHYTASKHGIIGLMRNVALEMAPFGVRCNAIVPGAIDTPMNNWQGALDLFAGKPGGTEEDRQRAGANFSILPDAGMMPPEVMAEAAFWLVSPAARYVTGIVLPVEAGHLITPGYG